MSARQSRQLNKVAHQRLPLQAACLSLVAVVLLLLYGAVGHAHTPGMLDGVPVTLEHVVERAKETSIAADLARTQLAVGEWQAQEMRAPLNPQMTLEAMATQFDRTQVVDPMCVDLEDTVPWLPLDEICIPPETMEINVDGTQASAKLSLRGVIFPSALVRATRTVADRTVEAATARYDQALEEITVQIVDLYYGILQAEAGIRLIELALEEAQLDLQETEWRVDVGSATEVDRLEATAKVMQLRGQLTEAQGTLDSLRIRLNQVAGYPLETRLVLERPQEKPAVIPSVKRALAAAIVKRPDIRQADSALAQAVAHETIVRAQEGPSIQLFGTVQGPDVEYTAGIDRHGIGQISVEGTRQELNNELMDSTEEGWVIGIQGSWAFLDGGSRQAKLAQAAQQVEAATLHRELLISGIEADLRRYEAELLGARSALDSTKKALEAMMEAEERMAEMHRRGAVSDGDLLRIQLGRMQADQQVLEAEHKYAKARFEYMRTAGLLFEDWF